MTAKYSGKIVWKGTSAQPDATKFSGMIGHDIENNIYYFSNGTSWLPSANWSDSTGTALVGPDGVNRPALLGVFTWAQLQTDYPNGGAALAALPAGVRVLVTDWAEDFVPNAAKTRWRPIAAVTLKTITAAIVNTTADGSTNAAFEATIPAGLVEPGGVIRLSAAMTGALNTNQKIWYGGVASSSGGAGVNGASQLCSIAHTSSSSPNSGMLCRIVFPATNPAAVYSAPPNQANQAFAGATTPLGASFNMDTTACYAQITQRLFASGSSMQIDWAGCYYEPPGV